MSDEWDEYEAQMIAGWPAELREIEARLEHDLYQARTLVVTVLALVASGSLVPVLGGVPTIPHIGAAKGTLPPLRNGGAAHDARDQGERSAPSSLRLGAQPRIVAAGSEVGLPSEVTLSPRPAAPSVL